MVLTVLEKDVNDKEFKGRYEFQEFCKKQDWCTVNRFSTKTNTTWDVGFWSAGTQMIGEIKYRNYNSNDYDTWFLELDKLTALKDIKYLHGIDPKTKLLYINFYNNGAVRIWDLERNYDYRPYQKELPKNNSYDDTKTKLVIDLRNEDIIFEITGKTSEVISQERVKEIRKQNWINNNLKK